jgi:hypothetical protein
MNNGKFHGVITPTTGWGRYTVVSFLAAESGIVRLRMIFGQEFLGVAHPLIEHVCRAGHLDARVRASLTSLDCSTSVIWSALFRHSIPELEQPFLTTGPMPSHSG